MSQETWVGRALRWGGGACALLLVFGLGRCTASGPDPVDPVEDHAGHSDALWTCSMHPQIRQGEPGDCPICGMDLIPVDAGAGASTDRVVLSERARVLAELRTTPVRRHAEATSALHLLGRLEPAETTRRDVTTWIGGRIDRLHVNTTGERVRKGQVIATLYSPEVYSAHQDLLTAQGQLDRLASASPSAQQAAASALDAARQRLRLLGVPESEIERMAQASEPVRSVAIRSPFPGTVLARTATEGAYVQTGATLYQVADLGVLWVQLDAYESDLSLLQVGQSVDLMVDALPGETVPGRIDFIDPSVDPTRRTARVRVVVDNGDGRMRPGMFAEAVVQVTAADGDSPLVIPDTAPLFTGRRSVVYVQVDTDQGPAYEPRTVRLGPRLGDVYPVVSGLSAGERVVSRGAFAIDADLQIRGGASMMTRADDRSPDVNAPFDLSDAERAALQPVLARYLEVQRALAADDLAAATGAAAALGDAVQAVSLPPRAQSAWRPIADALSGHGAHVAGSDSLEGARAGFEALSAAVEAVLTRFGNPLDQPVQVAFCPMASGSQGARWVQAGPSVDNAYFGDAMRTCGDIEEVIAPGTTLDASSAGPDR